MVVLSVSEKAIWHSLKADVSCYFETIVNRTFMRLGGHLLSGQLGSYAWATPVSNVSVDPELCVLLKVCPHARFVYVDGDTSGPYRAWGRNV